MEFKKEKEKEKCLIFFLTQFLKPSGAIPPLSITTQLPLVSTFSPHPSGVNILAPPPLVSTFPLVCSPTSIPKIKGASIFFVKSPSPKLIDPRVSKMCSDPLSKPFWSNPLPKPFCSNPLPKTFSNGPSIFILSPFD
ncbi:hypothetical protein Syun_014327 [Stephania yunnanensis]|uniref:Uncharacterized protein n=1 Tax=Stephania yunnanensis TaxID=152371 RepID=A0AAP0JJB2_9MAGN